MPLFIFFNTQTMLSQQYLKALPCFSKILYPGGIQTRVFCCTDVCTLFTIFLSPILVYHPSCHSEFSSVGEKVISPFQQET
jgi:hypothetical protein